MKRIVGTLLAVSLLLALCACTENKIVEDLTPPKNTQAETIARETTTLPKAETTVPPEVLKTENIIINGIYVDDSYQDKQSSALKMVYMFYTLIATDTNLSIDSKYTNMKINGKNSYESAHFASQAKACSYTPSYYYSSYLKQVYVGTQLKVVATFKIPESDLAAGRTVTFTDTQIPGIEKLRLKTDYFQHCRSAEAVAEAADPTGYSKEMAKYKPANAATVTKVRNLVNGYYWKFYANSTWYELEFFAPNTFEVRSILTNRGTYDVLQGYIALSYNGGSSYAVYIPYEFKNGDIELNCSDAFDVKG